MRVLTWTRRIGVEYIIYRFEYIRRLPTQRRKALDAGRRHGPTRVVYRF